MASSMAQIFIKSLQNININKGAFYINIRHSSIPPKKKSKPGTIKYRNIIASSCESLASRGFLRSQKPYTPKNDAVERVTAICNQILGPNYEPSSPLSKEEKFTVLKTCFEQFDHSVPNSLLHKINCINDITEFYKTPVSTTVPFDEFKKQDLPPNLHIQYDYVRFHPDTDTKFKGISAYPERSVIVTGLKYKDKYKGFRADPPYFYDNIAHFDEKV